MPDNIIPISIGRGRNCDVIIPDKTVSNLHALAEIHYYDEVYLIDRDSSNGTFINGKRIKKARIKTTDKIRIGDYQPDNEQFFKELFDRYKSKKTDFSREFKSILMHFNTYQKKLDSLQDNPKGPLYLKLGLLALLVGVLLFYQDSIDQRYFYPMIIGLSGITLLGSLFTGSRGKRNEEIAKLKIKYDKLLRCPKCNTSYINKHLVMMKNMESCLNEDCKAKFSTSESIDTI